MHNNTRKKKTAKEIKNENGTLHEPISDFSSVHDWEEEKNINKDFFDDGTMSFFW